MNHGNFHPDDDYDDEDFDNIPYKEYKLPNEIKDLCKEQLNFPYQLESDERIYFDHDQYGHIIFHIQPKEDNKDNAYFTVWENEDYKKQGYKYTIEFSKKMIEEDEEVEDEEVEDDDFDIITVRQTNNIISALGTINLFWLQYEPN